MKMIRWYDYIICVLLADLMTGMLFASSIFVFVPYILFEIYCDYRKEEEMKGE